MSKQCLNCLQPLSDNFNYCPHCAQKTHLHRLSLHDVLHEAIHYFTHADKGIIHLLKDLLKKTGTVAKEYVAGKRKKYFPPLNFFLLVATIYVLIMSFVTPHPSDNVLKNHPEVNYIPNAQQRERVIHIYERQEKAVYFLNKYSNVVGMIAIPLLCFIYWLFYIKGRYNYTEHLVASMYMTGFTNLLYVVILVPLSLLLMFPNSILVGSLMIMQVIYNSVYYYRFIGKATKLSAVKATGVSLFAVAFWIVLSGVLVRMYIKNGFNGLLH